MYDPMMLYYYYYYYYYSPSYNNNNNNNNNNIFSLISYGNFKIGSYHSERESSERKVPSIGSLFIKLTVGEVVPAVKRHRC
jgi:hypothetical protein